jgi:hypothetical protein
MMKKTTLAIGLLVATNLATAAFLGWQLQSDDEQIYVDHIEDMRLKTSDGTLQATLDDSRSGSSETLVFTPHGALQFHHELGRMFTLIQKKAADVAKGQRAAPQSPGPSL